MKFQLREKEILEVFIPDRYLSLQDFLDEFIPSKKIQHLCIQNGWIMLEEVKPKRETLIKNKSLMISLYPQKTEYPVLNDDGVEVLYEDPFAIAVHKPSGMLVHSDGNEEITLLDRVRSRYHDSGFTIDSLHRLDRETSGLVLFSKSPLFAPLLNSLLEEKKISRSYQAIIQGKLEPGKHFTVNKPIGRDRHRSGRMIISRNGQNARTDFTVVACDGQLSVLRCNLHTGRTHQIRVHLSSLSLPIINDEIYGIPSSRCSHMALVADRLSFRQPLSNRNISIQGIIPDDINSLIKEVCDHE